jgi:hypothetical protein
MRLTSAEREVLRKNVKNLIPQMEKLDIVNHFKKEGYSRKTIYNTIDRMNGEGSFKDNKRTGRPPVLDVNNRKKLKRLANNRTGVSQRRLASKFVVCQRTIGNTLAKMNITCRKREKTPKYDEKQRQKSQELCRKLANKFYRTSCSVILDDEKYFVFYGSKMPQNAHYYTDNKETCPDDVRFHGVNKFPKKILVHVSISNKGVSRALILPHGSESINTDVYIRECLQKRLLPFIQEYHSDKNYIFWPDLASSHYSNKTQAWFKGKNKYFP